MEAQIDFTCGSSLGVAIAVMPFPHLLFRLVLGNSGWRYAEMATGETFLAHVSPLGQAQILLPACIPALVVVETPPAGLPSQGPWERTLWRAESCNQRAAVSVSEIVSKFAERTELRSS